MAQPDRNSQRDNKRNNEPNFNWRGIVLIAIAFGLIGMALLVRNGGFYNRGGGPPNPFPPPLGKKQIILDKKIPTTPLRSGSDTPPRLLRCFPQHTPRAGKAGGSF